MCDNYEFDFGDECDRRYEEQRQEQVDRQARGEFFQQLEMDFLPVVSLDFAYDQYAILDPETCRVLGSAGIERSGTG